ncbi:hypothetical protein JAAARDRAFT_209497 [Jaapia argillacea MUCL 33604]|uniref:Uncharacterized protein n=1 Tax=Jaapia argillacea MUCL 33604 TaxID=933084 RepID=A0A067PVS2_9AGAM|nr:hypothetical protein JAAARDRAFT_209497 [Jaapia argillacea MUCL 33604]
MSDNSLGLDPAVQQRIQEVLSSSLDEDAIAAELGKIIVGPPYERFPAVAHFRGPTLIINSEPKHPGILPPLGGEEFDGKIRPPVEGESHGFVLVRRQLRGFYRIEVSLTQKRTTILFRKRLIGDPRLPGEEELDLGDEPDEQVYINDPARIDAVVSILIVTAELPRNLAALYLLVVALELGSSLLSMVLVGPVSGGAREFALPSELG